MSILRPKGISCEVAGVERHLLFTLAVVDDLEDHYDLPVESVMEMLTDERKVYKVLSYVLTALINDEIAARNYTEGKNEPAITEEEIKWSVDVRDTGRLARAVMQAYGYSFPEADEGQDPNAMSRSG